MPGQIVGMRGIAQKRMQRCRGKMERSIKASKRVQSGQSEGEVLDWTVRSEQWGGGLGAEGRGRVAMQDCTAIYS
ncbi:unnamed protein product, partial [Onchocerca flexuosa]|uniref:Uncharacterized protein n=1 Tax=Onchocerca flexuosa TaxID=387005 RepID=A0A183HG65_9BILA